MWDKANVQQHEALGIAGVNLIYAALYYRDDPDRFVASLVDNLGAARLEVDMLHFSGPAFTHVENRLMALHLVHRGLTNAVVFGPNGRMLQPSAAFHQRAILVERGGFRPVTRVSVDMLKCAQEQFMNEPAVRGREIAVLTEISIGGGSPDASADFPDVLARVDLLVELGYPVMISNYTEYFHLTSHFRRHTREMISVALRVTSLLEIFDNRRYENLEGGILESIGRMFKSAVRLYVHPEQRRPRERGAALAPVAGDSTDGDDDLLTANNLRVADHLRHLYQHLLVNRYIECLTGFEPGLLGIHSRDVLRRLQEDDPSWELMVPPPVAAAIKSRGLFRSRETDERALANPIAAGS